MTRGKTIDKLYEEAVAEWEKLRLKRKRNWEEIVAILLKNEPKEKTPLQQPSPYSQ